MYYGEKVRLRAMEMSDLDEIMKHWNTYETRRFLYSAIPHSEENERKWLEEVTTSTPWKSGSMVLAIEDKKSGQFLGSVSLDNISTQHRRAEFGIAIHDPKNHGKGYGTDATKVMLWVGFHVLGLNSIFLNTLVSNARAIRCYEKAGFQRTGIFRRALFTEGQFQDLLIMDVIADEFAKQHPGSTQIGSPNEEHQQ
ncbi:MAG: hypothetical protein C4K49_02465 [Candidatus Thorarchaeota archaeon]|nr:MAG: hypothetical protein C4K49_02465 [Candidatus Thorarchaeota archaeon]